MGVRSKSGGDSGPTVPADEELSPLTRLIDALSAEKTRFIVVGMTGAVLQGTPVTTFDIDLWIDLPPRQYMRMINLSRGLGAQMVSSTIAVLPGDITLNFIYEVTGLSSFATEFRHTHRIDWMGRKVAAPPIGTHLREQKGRRPAEGPRAFAFAEADHAAPKAT